MVALSASTFILKKRIEQFHMLTSRFCTNYEPKKSI